MILDTHAFLWLADSPDRLSSGALRAIAEDPEPAISAITVQEIAYLAARGRLEFDRSVGAWVRAALATQGVDVHPLDTAIALRAGSLDPAGFPGDPADRIIYATALERGTQLLSRDEDIASFDPARVLW